MTELVITDPKFLNRFREENRRIALGAVDQIVIHNSPDYSHLKGGPEDDRFCVYLTDDEYEWVMLRAMEEGLI